MEIASTPRDPQRDRVVAFHPEVGPFRAPSRPSGPRIVRAKVRLAVTDLLAVHAGLVLSVVVMARFDNDVSTRVNDHLWLLAATFPIWPVVLTRQLLYRARFIARGADEAWRLTKATTSAMTMVALIAFFLHTDIARAWFGLAFVSSLALLGTNRAIARTLFRRARRRGDLMREVLIVGKNAEAMLVREMLDTEPDLGYRVIGHLEDLIRHEPDESPFAALRRADRAVEAVKDVGASGVIIAATAIDIGTSNRLIRAFTDNGIHVELSSTLCDIASDRLTVRPLGRFPMVYIEPVVRHGWRPIAKRAFDVFVALGLLVIALPVLAITAVALKLTSPGPVLFRQTRVGQDGRLFEILKFRTMVIDAEDRLDEVRHLNEAEGPIFKIRDDPRVTRVGRLLRKTSIDELPQLINVARGEMSLVGPRPSLPSEVALWEPGLWNRLRVKPGMTGMWQVSGRSDATGDFGQLDLYYVDNWNLVTDLVILARTGPAVLLQRGAA